MTLTTTRETKALSITRALDFDETEKGMARAIVTETGHRNSKLVKLDVKSYLIRRLPADWGEGFEVSKLDGSKERYHVHLDGQQGDCSCPGGTYCNACRHLDMVREALRTRRI